MIGRLYLVVVPPLNHALFRLGLKEIPSMEEVQEAKRNCERVGFAKLVMKQTPPKPDPPIKVSGKGPQGPMPGS